jgi:hypothetical protein
MGIAISKLFVSNTEQFAEQYFLPLSGNDALQALNKAEQLDGYITTVNQSPINVLARSQTTYMPSVYSVSIPIPFTVKPWPSGQVIWMNPTADEGLPHTRAPNYICLPATITNDHIANTVLHERVHVSQRLFPDIWETILKEGWDMKPWIGSFPNHISERRRINPDIHGIPLFIWKNTWVSLGIFKSLKNPKLQEIDIIWWNTVTRTVHKEVPPEWSDFFGNHPAGEHPYELAAYLIVEAPSNNKSYGALKSRLDRLPSS